MKFTLTLVPLQMFTGMNNYDDIVNESMNPYQRGVNSALLVFVATVFIWAELHLAPRPPELLLVQARRVIDAAAQRPPALRADTLRDIEQRLRAYLHHERADPDAGRLLLATTLAMRTSSDLDAPVAARRESEELLSQIRPEACSADDLLLAVQILTAAGHIAAAEGLIEQSLDYSRGTANQARALWLAAIVRYRQGRAEVVLDHCWELVALDPSDPEPWRLMARVHQDRRDGDQFVEAIWQVIQLDPGDAFDERLQLIDALITLGDRKRAHAQYALLETLAPERLADHPWLNTKLLQVDGRPAESLTTAAGKPGQLPRGQSQLKRISDKEPW